MKIIAILLLIIVSTITAQIPTGYVTLTNAKSGKVFSPINGSSENGAVVHQYDYAAPDQEWKFVEVESDYYIIENRLTGKVLDVENQSADAGARVQQWHYNGTLGQQWSVEGTYNVTITNRASGKVLAVENESTADAASLQQANPVVGTAQEWTLAEVAGNGASESFTETIYSPDGRASITFELLNGSIFYSVGYDDKPIIVRSGLGFYVKGSEPLLSFDLVESNNAVIDETWETVWGQDSLVHNNANELTVNLKEDLSAAREMGLVFRAYNDGVAFKYVFPKSMGDFDIMSEETYFIFADDSKTWWIQDQWFSYEDIYNETSLSQVEGANTPITMKSTDGIYYSIHEADLTDYAGMTFMPTGGPLSFKADLVPWADGTKVKVTVPHQSPWRTVQLADRSGGLMESHLIQNLNDPNEIEDTSWIKPTKYIGIWWGMHMGEYTWTQGEKHGATTANAKKYIDYASDFGMDGVLIEGWNIGWSSQGWSEMDFTTPYDDFDIDVVTQYAASKGVFLIGHHETGSNIVGNQYAYDDQLEAALDFYQSKGVPAIKTGYVGEEQLKSPNGENKHGQLIVRHYQRVIEEAAKRNIMINAHEPIKGTGIDRTWPNFIAREGVRGNEYNAWGDPINPKDHAVVIPFTRILSGPIDFTPGIFDLNNMNGDQMNSTIAKQLAMYVVFYSPLQMAADLPRNYVDRPAFEFIRNVPLNWSKTTVIDSEIADHVTVARKNGNNWYIGSITDENARTITFTPDFLIPGAEYRMRIYVDASDTDYQSNPHSIDIKDMPDLIMAGSTITYNLKACGGAAIELIHESGPTVEPEVSSDSNGGSSSSVDSLTQSSGESVDGETHATQQSSSEAESSEVVQGSSDGSSAISPLWDESGAQGMQMTTVVNLLQYQSKRVPIPESVTSYEMYSVYGALLQSGVPESDASLVIQGDVTGVVIVRYNKE